MFETEVSDLAEGVSELQQGIHDLVEAEKDARKRKEEAAESYDSDLLEVDALAEPPLPNHLSDAAADLQWRLDARQLRRRGEGFKPPTPDSPA